MAAAHGFVAGGFEPMRSAFGDQLAAKRTGAGLSIHVAGRPMVRLWGGHRAASSSDDWSEDTLVNLFSISKTITALCVLRLVDRGRLGLDDPVCGYWPEFAANGKEHITIRQVLSHSAGVPGVSRALSCGDICNWTLMCELLEREAPWWEPGTKRGSHVFTYGHLLGEVVRRVAGVSIGTLWRNELAGVLNADVVIGMAEHDLPRAADIVRPFPAAIHSVDHDSILYRVVANPPVAFETQALNSRLWRQAEVPAGNAHGTAEGVARVFDLFARVGSQRRELIATDFLREAMRVQSKGWDEVLAKDVEWGLGLQTFGKNGSVAMTGMGGSFALANPAAETSFVFVTNTMSAMGDYSDAIALLQVASDLIDAPLA